MYKILGIDPGLARIGWGVVAKHGSIYTAIAWGRIETEKERSTAERLLSSIKKLEQLIARYKPTAMAVEELFFAKNVKTAISVAQMRGAILLTAARYHLPIFEYTPLEVKQALTGYGRADKRQIQMMLTALFKIRIPASQDDAADALAVAYTALVSQKHGITKRPVVIR